MREHNKIKNPAIVFELLLRKLTSDTVNGVDKSPSLLIIKEFFNKKTLLGKEHQLYQTLIANKFTNEVKANVLLEHVLQTRKTLNEKRLRTEKYNIVKKIKEHYDLVDFFNTKLDNYKLYASIYKLFENNSEISPQQIVKEKFYIIEHITSQSDINKNANTILEQFENEPQDIKLIAYKLLIDKFNRKYTSTLDENQKTLLKEYIYNASNNSTLLKYVKTCVPKLKKELSSYYKGIDDKVLKIKLRETVSLLDKFDTVKFIKDGDVLNLLRYYELLKEFKEMNNAQSK